MKIALLHLSDIHFRTDNFDTCADLRLAERISSAIRTELIGSTHVIILVSGDIAYSGIEDEYKYASDWLSELYTQVADSCAATCWILCAPGNHDVDHSRRRQIRNALIQQIRRDSTLSIDKAIIDECTQEQRAFFQFRDDLEGDAILVYTDPLLRVHRIRDGDSIVQINVLNSAWMSSMHEDPGSIVFPLDSYHDQIAKPSGFSISVMHHPLGWFIPENSRRLRADLSQCSSIVICGHEHMPESTRMLTSFGDHVRFIDGGALKTEDSTESSFNLILLDTESCKIKDYTFRSAGARFEGESKDDWEDATRLTSSESGRFRLRSSERTRLDEIGINILHPRKEQLLLRDLFVYPDLLPITSDISKSQGRWDRTISAETLIFGTKSTHNILEGADGAGKTALLKMYFSEFYTRGKIPMHMQGPQLKFGRDGDIRGALRKTFSATYEGEDFTQYEQLEPSERVLLVDDLDLSTKKSDGFRNCLEFIEQFFGKAILVTDDMLSFQKLAVGDGHQSVLAGYSYYSIQEFGHAKRDELIKRWILLGRQAREWNSLPTLSERDSSRVVINTTIGRNFMPSYPIVILIILQSRETGATSPIGSTYGHHYQFLITRSLIECGVRSEDLDAVSNYICELAFSAFYLKQVKEISGSEYNVWHERFCKEYGIDWDATRIRSRLENGSILSIESSGTIYFKYQYVYFFFLAKKLANCLGEKDVMERVRHMCERLHIVEYANIILFLIHHSSDEFVLDAVRRSASVLLQDHSSFELEGTPDNKLLGAINRLPSALGVPILEERDPDQEQARALKSRDIVEASSRELETQLVELDGYSDTTTDGLDGLAQAVVAAKTIELLGQTLRNYYGSLRIGIKVEIGRDTLDLALRAVTAFFELLGNDGFGFVDFLVESRREYEKEHTKESARKSDQELERWARDLMFNIFRMVGRAIIRKVANSLGFEQLRPTLQQLVPNSASISYRMVELAALLDGPRDIPKAKIESMARDLKNNPLGFQILRDFAAQRVYRYPTDYQDKQWLAEKLGFSMARQRSAELDSSRRIMPRDGADDGRKSVPQAGRSSG
ncbi:MAG: metallophosphoesterase [Rhodospirillaceae bacterium]|nr:metallophosphoesterase [Rhodospirillaceae bacterium]